MALKEVDYEGYKLYVCERCRPQWDTFDKQAAAEHEKNGLQEGGPFDGTHRNERKAGEK